LSLKFLSLGCDPTLIGYGASEATEAATEEYSSYNDNGDEGSCLDERDLFSWIRTVVSGSSFS